MDTQKVPRGMDKSMVVVGMPLSAIIQDQLENSYCPVATLSMGAELKGTSCMPEGEPALKCKKKTISEDDVLSGNFLILFAHPEALSSSIGQRILSKMGRNNMLRGLILDEAHQGLNGHWEKIRPGMLRKVFSQQVHLVPSSPIAAMTATLTEPELETVIKLAGQKKQPLVISDGPIQRNHKIVVLRQPTNQVPLQGRTDTTKGTLVPGLLQLLCLLILDKFVEVVKNGEPFRPFKKTIIFFRYYIFTQTTSHNNILPNHFFHVIFIFSFLLSS